MSARAAKEYMTRGGGTGTGKPWLQLQSLSLDLKSLQDKKVNIGTTAKQLVSPNEKVEREKNAKQSCCQKYVDSKQEGQIFLGGPYNIIVIQLTENCAQHAQEFLRRFTRPINVKSK